MHSLAGGGGTADQGLPLSDKAFEPQGHFSYCQALLLVLDVYHMGVGAFPFLRVTRRRHRDREYGTKGRGASHRPALNSNAHYFGRKSSVSGPMYVCCEDSSYRRQALKKCNCTTSTAQDQPSAGQGNIELSLERGRGCAASTAHRESYGGAGPGSRSQYCE